METEELFPYPEGSEEKSSSHLGSKFEKAQLFMIAFLLTPHHTSGIDLIVSACIVWYIIITPLPSLHATVLNAEQKESISLLVDPVTKFFEVRGRVK